MSAIFVLNSYWRNLHHKSVFYLLHGSPATLKRKKTTWYCGIVATQIESNIWPRTWRLIYSKHAKHGNTVIVLSPGMIIFNLKKHGQLSGEHRHWGNAWSYSRLESGDRAYSHPPTPSSSGPVMVSWSLRCGELRSCITWVIFSISNTGGREKGWLI